VPHRMTDRSRGDGELTRRAAEAAQSGLGEDYRSCGR
jgi:hypothetical protein